MLKSLLARLPAPPFGASRPTSTWSVLLSPRAQRDYVKAVGDGTGSNLVMACVYFICRSFPEAPLTLTTVSPGGTHTHPPRHPLLALISQPNPAYNGILLWNATLTDWLTSGNAYWLKIRDRRGLPVQLWWLPQSTVTPRWDGDTFVSHYDYTPNPATAPTPLAVRDVIHFRYGLDPANPRLGLSPLASLLRELYSDEEAAHFSAALLKNLGIPGVILSPDTPDVHLTADDAELLRADFRRRFTGDSRGEPMVLSAGIKAQTLSFNPRDMNLRDLRRIPEERVTAVLGVPAIAVGFGAGLERATFSNYSEAREAAYEQAILPAQRAFAADLTQHLLPDFGDPHAAALSFDASRVRVLQEDENHLAQRLATLVGAGIMTRQEARRILKIEG